MAPAVAALRELPSAHVIIPCFNHGRFIIDAVRSALNQPGARTRVIVVDDGSTDGSTPRACDECLALAGADAERVRVIHQPNRGLPAARNAGAALAREQEWAEYLVFLDADDFIEPTFTAELHRRIATEEAGEPGRGADQERGLISHAYCQERLVDRASGIWTVPDWDPLLLLVTNLHPVTCLVKRSCFEAAGGFDESMRLGYEDWELWLRFSSRGWRGVRVREPLFNWRRHSEITMVIEAVARHEQLFAAIQARHSELYRRHADALVRLSNTLLRKGDANWLDENREAIVVRDLRNANVQLWQDICKARQERDAAQNRAAALTKALKETRESFEHKPVIKVSRKLHKLLDAMPTPVGRAVKGAARAAARVVGTR